MSPTCKSMSECPWKIIIFRIIPENEFWVQCGNCTLSSFAILKKNHWKLFEHYWISSCHFSTLQPDENFHITKIVFNKYLEGVLRILHGRKELANSNRGSWRATLTSSSTTESLRDFLAPGFFPTDFSSYVTDSEQYEYVLLTKCVNMKPI